jgi:uncharacterized protein DUF4292
MKFIAYIFCVLIVFNACSPAKKVQVIEKAINSIDTVKPTVIVKPTETIDSFSVVKNIIKNLGKNRVDFKTFSAKVKVDAVGPDDENHVNAYVRIRRDSAIWIDIHGALNIDGVRLLVTKDSVKLINYIAHTYEANSVSYLQEFSQVPLSFYDLQDLIVGNPIFIDSNVVSYKATPNNLQVLMIGKIFKNLVTLENKTFKIIHSKLDDVDPNRNRTADITLSDYVFMGGDIFSTTREIVISEKSKLDISLTFKQYSFNQPQTFPFTVPKNAKRK